MLKEKIFYIIFSILIASISNLLCGEEEIEHCLECGTGDNNETCAKCEDKFFPFLKNVFCLPCDHEYYGMVGCGGKCSVKSNSYEEQRNIICEKDKCKEGYYNLVGFCVPCDFGSPFCGKCTYLPENTSETDTLITEDKYFKCQECINNEFKLNTYGRCEHCGMYKCVKCHFEPSGRQVCDKCINNYYVNNAKSCTKCHYPVYIYGGVCKVCSDDLTKYETGYCYCSSGYTANSLYSCISCSAHCSNCNYDKVTKTTHCNRCYAGYTLNSKGVCKSCGYGCAYCYLDSNENPICTSCFEGHNLNEDHNCLDCPEHCSSCKKGENDQLYCTSCYTYYGVDSSKMCSRCPQNCYNCFLKPETGEFGCSSCISPYIVSREYNCIRCYEIQEIGGEGCVSCSFDRYNDKYKCYRCLGDIRPSLPRNDAIQNYSFVKNTYQCLSNLNKTNEYLHGCLESKYDDINKKYLCDICKIAFIPILNEKSCKLPNDISLSSDCLTANKVNNEGQTFYSCLSCKYSSNVKVTNHLGKMDCLKPINELVYCREAIEDENGNRQCIKCQSDFQFIYSDIYNKNICDNKCDIYSFFKWGWCYKCDDKYYGNPGCLLEEGCKYKSINDELDCTICKTGYFNFTYGQCFSCSKENYACNKCHLNSYFRFECDECMDGFLLDNQKKICVPNTCEEYPEITPGCIICQANIELKPQNKCEACKPGYFKTKDESCIYCKARYNGGPACEICEYIKDENGTETDDIKCKYCPEGNILSSDGKCYNCKDELGIGCSNCSFVKNDENGKEKLECNKCENDYNLSTDKHCIHYQSYFKLIPHCNDYYYEYNSNMGNISKNNSDSHDNKPTPDGYIHEFDISFDDNDYLSKKKGRVLEEEEKIENFAPNEFRINSICKQCKKGYFLNNGSCVNVSVLDCSFISILSDSNEKYYSCLDFCGNKQFSKIVFNLGFLLNNAPNSTLEYYADEIIDYLNSNYYFNITNISDLYNEEYTQKIINLDEIVYKYGINNEYLNYLDDNTKSILYNLYLCLSNSGSGLKYEPKNLKKCKRSLYIESNDSYVCVECISGYSLDVETNLCKQSIKINMNLRPGISNCYIENLGTNQNPLYSCKVCYDQDNVLVNAENGTKFCEKKEHELEGCLNATANTSYLNNEYNCSECEIGYIPYYSRFFKRKICQYIYEDIIKFKEFDSEAFNDDVEYMNLTNNSCNDKFFTPDGERCYACNNRAVGMVGCKGTCTFSQKRNNVIECEEGKCKTGYLEKTKGVCEPCDTVNVGCIECHYDNNYLKDYFGFRRSRRFVCDTCEEGYLKSEDGTCHNCTELGFYNCERCKRDENNDNDLVCYQCSEGYFLTDYGECTKCNDNQVRGISNTCINCSDVEEGGIEGCQACENLNDSIICKECKFGFMLLENNKTCLKISENKELEKFINCEKLSLENNRLHCSKCIENYTLLNEINDFICVSTNFISTPHPNLNQYCQKFTNLGTKNKPKYSCEKCNKFGTVISVFNYTFYDYKYNYSYSTYNYTNTSLTKITYEENYTSFCNSTDSFKKLENCTEATMKVINKTIILNCTKCKENNNLTYHKDTDSNICRYTYYQKNCAVKYCKTCQKDNNYFCQECLPTDYEVNPITGSCVKKMPKPPAITFKDIFRLQLNKQRTINGRRVFGPSLMLRGMTTSQINTRHAFLIYMTFKVLYTRAYRNLEEEKKIPTICEVVDSVDESEDEINMVEYDCIGNLTEEENEELEDYKLNTIKESKDENTKVLSKSNLQEVVNITDINNLEHKTKPEVHISEIKFSTIVFTIDEGQAYNQTSEDFKFNFTINGKINQELASEEINVEVPISEIEEKAANCTFNIKELKRADLSCNVNVEDYKEYKILSFGQIALKNNEKKEIFLSRIDEVKLINEQKEIKEEKKEDKNNTMIIIITVVAIIAAFIIVITITLLIKKHNQTKLEKNKNNNRVSQKYYGNEEINSKNQFQSN